MLIAHGRRQAHIEEFLHSRSLSRKVNTSCTKSQSWWGPSRGLLARSWLLAAAHCPLAASRWHGPFAGGRSSLAAACYQLVVASFLLLLLAGCCSRRYAAAAAASASSVAVAVDAPADAAPAPVLARSPPARSAVAAPD